MNLINQIKRKGKEEEKNVQNVRTPISLSLSMVRLSLSLKMKNRIYVMCEVVKFSSSQHFI